MILVMDWLARVGDVWRLGIRLELQVGFPVGALLVFFGPHGLDSVGTFSVEVSWLLFGQLWWLFGQLLDHVSFPTNALISVFCNTIQVLAC